MQREGLSESRDEDQPCEIRADRTEPGRGWVYWFLGTGSLRRCPVFPLSLCLCLLFKSANPPKVSQHRAVISLSLFHHRDRSCFMVNNLTSDSEKLTSECLKFGGFAPRRGKLILSGTLNCSVGFHTWWVLVSGLWKTNSLLFGFLCELNPPEAAPCKPHCTELVCIIRMSGNMSL